MKLKQILAFLIAAAMTLCLFAGCDNTPDPTDPSDTTPTDTQPSEPDGPAPSTDPLTMIYEGYYTYTYPIDGMDDMCAFFHFYPEAPVLGSVFYASFAWNQIVFCGTYTVEKADFEYSVYPERGAEEKISGIAPYTVTFYDFDGNLLDTCGYDGEKLYNDMEKITGVGCGESIYHHILNAEETKYWSTIGGEIGQAYLSFVAVEDKTCTVTLAHNCTYTDLVSMMVEGSWTMAQNDDGTYTFTLDPTEDYDVGATLLVSADKTTATYTSADGSVTMEMVDINSTGPQIVHQLKGLYFLGEGLGDADVILDLYDDGKCYVNMSAFGSVMPIDEGTYSIGADGYTITCNFKAAGEISSYLSEYGVSMQYVCAGTAMGDLDLTLNYAAAAPAEPVLLYTFQGTHFLGEGMGDAVITLSMYDDGNCAMVIAAYGQSMDLDAGTYAIGADGFTITFQFGSAGELVSNLNGYNVELHYVNAASPLGPVDSVLTIVME